MNIYRAISLLLISALSTPALGDTFGNGANTFVIEFVTIGNPGNAADTTGNPNPAGSVPYTYNMGKYDVSRDMIAKANMLGNLAISLADMTSFGGNGVNRPATGVSWNEVARFMNWLNTSTGSSPVYKFALQPGDGGYSSNADIQLWTPSDPGYNPNNLYRNSLAHYFLPSVDEWYKAAYYEPTSGVYYDYPTGSNIAPTAVASGTTAGTAVYNQSFGTGPANITLAGALSPYGTMGQGGNVNQWEETSFDLSNNSSSSARGVRGGSWVNDSIVLSSSIRSGVSQPTRELTDVGFRVANIAIPEPSTLLLVITASATLPTVRPNRSPRIASNERRRVATWFDTCLIAFLMRLAKLRLSSSLSSRWRSGCSLVRALSLRRCWRFSGVLVSCAASQLSINSNIGDSMNWKIFRGVTVIAILVTGCSKGGLGKAELEAKVAELHKWHDVSLQKNADGSYKGTAVMANGGTLNVEVEQGPRKISARWKNADGNGYGSSENSW